MNHCDGFNHFAKDEHLTDETPHDEDDTQGKSSGGSGRFKPKKKHKILGFDLSEFIGSHGRDTFYILQTVGGIGLALSGYMDENTGRLATGVLNTGRNLSWNIIKQFLPQDKADSLASSFAFLSNIPQAVGAAGASELAAGATVLSAYAIRSLRGMGVDIKDPGSTFKNISEMSGIKSKVVGLGRVGKKAAAQAMTNGPSVFLFARATAQLYDGLSRGDMAATAAGAAFVAGAVIVGQVDRHLKAQNAQKAAISQSPEKQSLKHTG